MNSEDRIEALTLFGVTSARRCSQECKKREDCRSAYEVHTFLGIVARLKHVYPGTGCGTMTNPANGSTSASPWQASSLARRRPTDTQYLGTTTASQV